MNRNRRPGGGQTPISHRSRFTDTGRAASSSPRRTCNSHRPNKSTCNDAIPTAASIPGNTATDLRFPAACREAPEPGLLAKLPQRNRRPLRAERAPDSRRNSRLHGYNTARPTGGRNCSSRSAVPHELWGTSGSGTQERSSAAKAPAKEGRGFWPGGMGSGGSDRAMASRSMDFS
jgi:hypothetical protein